MKTTAAILSALALAAVAAPASAAQQDNLRTCKAQLVEAGHADSADALSFKSAKRNRVTLETESGAKVACKFRRGEVTALVVDGVEIAMTARKVAEARK